MAYIFRHLLLAPPKSLPSTSVLEVALVDGRTALLTLDVKVTVSLVASPKVTLPLKVEVPETVKFVKVSKSVEGL